MRNELNSQQVLDPFILFKLWIPGGDNNPTSHARNTRACTASNGSQHGNAARSSSSRGCPLFYPPQILSSHLPTSLFLTALSSLIWIHPGVGRYSRLQSPHRLMGSLSPGFPCTTNTTCQLPVSPSPSFTSSIVLFPTNSSFLKSGRSDSLLRILLGDASALGHRACACRDPKWMGDVQDFCQAEEAGRCDDEWEEALRVGGLGLMGGRQEQDERVLERRKSCVFNPIFYISDKVLCTS